MNRNRQLTSAQRGPSLTLAVGVFDADFDIRRWMRSPVRTLWA